ncbi:MAG: hypothetical protein WD847_03335 [Pirellulales bacterium]|jgi:hypothetical protein
MWRALFLALGAYACLLGFECLVIDKAVLAESRQAAPGLLARMNPARGPGRDLTPSDWAPWSLLSAGAVTMLYSFTIPQRVKSKA